VETKGADEELEKRRAIGDDMQLNDFAWDPAYAEMALRLFAALAIGGLIGLERSHHGRPAGFRTHALVCLSTALLMLVTVYETRWFPGISQGRVALDPTRLAQGIMTGIGFLGAGTIMKDGVSVRGLTTAASVWITAAIGILVGVGFWFPALLATVLTLGTLSVFRWIEDQLPARSYARLALRFAGDRVMPEDELRRLLAGHGFKVANLSYRRDAAAGHFEYRMTIRTNHPERTGELSRALDRLDALQEYRVSPAGD
jgi:putative Mg2+ transporter-C (MgtC) family protein